MITLLFVLNIFMMLKKSKFIKRTKDIMSVSNRASKFKHMKGLFPSEIQQFIVIYLNIPLLIIDRSSG